MIEIKNCDYIADLLFIRALMLLLIALKLTDNINSSWWFIITVPVAMDIVLSLIVGRNFRKDKNT